MTRIPRLKTQNSVVIELWPKLAVDYSSQRLAIPCKNSPHPAIGQVWNRPNFPSPSDTTLEILGSDTTLRTARFATGQRNEGNMFVYRGATPPHFFPLRPSHAYAISAGRGLIMITTHAIVCGGGIEPLTRAPSMIATPGIGPMDAWT